MTHKKELQGYMYIALARDEDNEFRKFYFGIIVGLLIRGPI